MSLVSAPADRRFRRAHVKPVRRRGTWRGLARPALHATLLIGALFAAYRGGGAATGARALQVDRILVNGTVRLSTGEVQAMLGGLRGESIVRADLAAWRRRLLASPWVLDAALRRSLPSTIEVVVSEREPIGIARLDGELYLVDDRAVVIDEYGPQYADVDLPIIDGLAASSGAAGAKLDEVRAAFAGRLIESLESSPDVARRVSQVDVSDLHNATVILSGDPAVLYVGEDRFLSRLQSYLELVDTLRARVDRIDYVDLRFGDRIYVGPTAEDARRADRGRR